MAQEEKARLVLLALHQLSLQCAVGGDVKIDVKKLVRDCKEALSWVLGEGKKARKA